MCSPIGLTCDDATARPSFGVHMDGTLVSDPPSESPLWMVTEEHCLNQFFTHLQRKRHDVMERLDASHEMTFSRSDLEEVRAAFARMIRNGEKTLHQLSHLLCETYFTSFQIQSVVMGEVVATKEPLTLTQVLTKKDLYSTLDIDLGTRQLDKLMFHSESGLSHLRLVANVVDYLPTIPNGRCIFRITTRIKAEEELWSKVVDELFDLDALVDELFDLDALIVKDKQICKLSHYVKDVFGIKIVVGEAADIPRMCEALEALVLPDTLLMKNDVKPGPATSRLEFVEDKNYLGAEHRKRSGWEARKLVVRWSDKIIEIQVQSLQNFLQERELLTQESHASFKAQREAVRAKVAERIPQFRFYRDLLMWLFRNPASPCPTYPGITITLVD